MHRTSWMYIWCELSFDRTLFESWLVRIHSHMEWWKKENISICICSISMRFSIWTCGMMKNESSHSQQHTHILFFWMQLKMSSAHWTVHFNIICFQTLFVYAWWILWLAKIKVFYTSSLFSQVIAFTSLFARISPFLSSFFFKKKGAKDSIDFTSIKLRNRFHSSPWNLDGIVSICWFLCHMSTISIRSGAKKCEEKYISLYI